MKLFLLIILFIIAFINFSNGQDVPGKIVQSFSGLKIQMIKKSEIVTKMISHYKEIKTTDSSMFKDTKETAAELTKKLNRHTLFDSSYVLMIGSTTEYFNLLVAGIEKKLSIQKISDQKITVLRFQLEAAENRIAILKKDYNNLCLELKRLDLLLKTEEITTGDNKIEF